MASEASHALAAALEQMDGIIAGTASMEGRLMTGGSCPTPEKPFSLILLSFRCREKSLVGFFKNLI